MVRSINHRHISLTQRLLWSFTLMLSSIYLVIPQATLGSTQASSEESEEAFLGISGLIVDETRTVVGRNFYETFTAQWTNLSSTTQNIVISELADPRFGSIISVQIGEKVVFRRLLPPRLGDLEEAVDMAIVNVRQTLTDQERVQQELEMY
ncbi:CsgE family curli-type amyloid fiber assembly protein [Nitrospira sp. M1]